VGSTLIFILMIVALLCGLASSPGINDRAPFVADDAPVTEIPLGVAHTPRPSNWPIVAAAAVGIMAVGVAVHADVVLVGFIGTLIGAGGWLGQAWREAAGWDAAKGRRLNERFVAPLGIPLGAIAVIAIMVVSISRVLLAVNEHASVVVALVAAVLVLVIFSLLATRARLSRGLITVIVTIAGVGLATAGVAGAAKGERKFERPESETTQLTLVAKDTTFNKNTLEAPAGETFQIKFTNDDSAVYHNVGVYTQPGAKPVVDGQPISGVNKITYNFEVPSPGTYTFKCDFHANMTGTLTVK
jgi:plastocyanin